MMMKIETLKWQTVIVVTNGTIYIEAVWEYQTMFLNKKINFGFVLSIKNFLWKESFSATVCNVRF